MNTSPLTVLGVTHDALNFAMPAEACDCHTHVFGPSANYPLSPERNYMPGDALVSDLLALHDGLHIARVVIVHPSPYGSDNACTLDALRVLGPRGRGVTVIDAHTTDAQLRAMHEVGVRGIRLNLETSGIHDPDYAATQLRWATARVAPLGWHLQMFTNLHVMASLREVIETLDTPVVFDHFCLARAELGTSQPHFDSLLALLASGRVWLKLSAPHRVSQDPDGAAMTEMARTLIAHRPDRLVWGSDWPHPGGRPGQPRHRDQVEAFNPINDGHALNRLAAWVDDAATLRQILATNPARFYDF